MNEENKDGFSVEEAFRRIEEITAKLSAPDTGLKESMTLYAEGVELVKKCEESLEGIEKEMRILTEEETDV